MALASRTALDTPLRGGEYAPPTIWPKNNKAQTRSTDPLQLRSSKPRQQLHSIVAIDCAQVGLVEHFKRADRLRLLERFSAGRKIRSEHDLVRFDELQ